MNKQCNQSNYTDKRTGIVYANVCTNNANQTPALMQPHLDAFIPNAFLKTYFGKEKSETTSIWMRWNKSSSSSSSVHSFAFNDSMTEGTGTEGTGTEGT